jgi:lipoprotein-anchoring transpeptidase ErfK/SrfK
VLGVGSAQPQAAKIVVSKSKGTLKAYDTAGKLVGMYTATMGSRHDPLPLGRWKVIGLARNPDFAFNPELFWDVPDGDAKQQLPPGPNGPVGVAWIDLDKEHYGIHGTPEPSMIGRAQSHGCVRLTNWDVARLAQMVKPGTQVLFES